MSRTIDPGTLNQWYVLDALNDIPASLRRNRLLGVELTTLRDADGAIIVSAEDRDDPLPVRERYGYLWTTLGKPGRDVLPIPEADEADRRHVVCGAVSVRY
jgi:hypothetical protein